jgi:hypothetical protein
MALKHTRGCKHKTLKVTLQVDFVSIRTFFQRWNGGDSFCHSPCDQLLEIYFLQIKQKFITLPMSLQNTEGKSQE